MGCSSTICSVDIEISVCVTSHIPSNACNTTIGILISHQAWILQPSPILSKVLHGNAPKCKDARHTCTHAHAYPPMQTHRRACLTLTLTPVYRSMASGLSEGPASSSSPSASASACGSGRSLFCMTSSPWPPGASSAKISLKFLATCCRTEHSF